MTEWKKAILVSVVSFIAGVVAMGLLSMFGMV